MGLRCQLFPGGFSGERVIEVQLASRKTYRGLAPLHYCWTDHGHPLKPDEPAPGSSLHGIVAARLLSRQSDGLATVTVPDGEILVVSDDVIVDRPETELTSNVPLRQGPAVGA